MTDGSLECYQELTASLLLGSPQSSQVPQPTCYWKWVGVPLPLKHHNFTLQASRAFIMASTLEEVYFLELSVYGEQFFSWQNFHTCIGCGATAAWRAPPIWTFGTACIFARICHIFQQYFSVLLLAFAAHPAAATKVMLCGNESSTQINFSLYLY